MAENSNIEWTDATWNPIVGCSIVSPGCTNCYAMRMAHRIQKMTPGSHYVGTTALVKNKPVWTGKLALAPEHILLAPLRWKKPRAIFVNSMGDLFHEDCPDEWIDRVFAVMALASQHTFQVLTKRAARMRDYLTRLEVEHKRAVGVMACGTAANFSDLYPAVDAFPHYCSSLAHPSQHNLWPLPNVWLGVSTEDQKRADERIPDLLHTPAAIRFISAEPLLGVVNLQKISLGRSEATFYGHPDIKYAEFFMDALRGVNKRAIPPLNWVIAGGESGPQYRHADPGWFRSLRDQCARAGVPFLFKQWEGVSQPIIKAKGRELDGVVHDGYPTALKAMLP